MKYGLNIIFDNAPSAHKEGFIENKAINNDILILHLPNRNDKIHPSETYLNDRLFNSCRFYLNPESSIKNIKQNILDIIKDNFRGKKYSSISIIYSFLDIKRLYMVRFLSEICSEYSSKIILIPHYEPIRLNDIFVLPRLIKIGFSLKIQKMFLRVNHIYLFSNLNKFFYLFFFKKYSIYPYLDAKQKSIVETKKIKKLSYSTNKFLNIIFVGQLIKRKDPFLLLKSCMDLKFNVKITIIGEGYLKEILRNFVRKNNRSNIEVKFLGEVDNNELMQIIKKNDVLVLPSRFDGFGFVVREAIQYGTYTIVSSQVGSKDLIKNGKKGAVFNVGSRTELINQLNLHFLRKQI
tara:strand:- start:602 stop:1648 length:1047 start_codon:yes stop_codon:yes gene_type:complete